MNEAKSIVGMAVSAMIGALILGACVSLITLGYMLWNSFAYQDRANRRVQMHAVYAAYDGAMVRGQDIISLIQKAQGDPAVIVVGYENSAEAITENPNQLKLLLVSNTGYNSNMSPRTLWQNNPQLDTPNTQEYIKEIGTTFNAFASTLSGITSNPSFKYDGEHKFAIDFSTSAANNYIVDLQTFLLNRGALRYTTEDGKAFWSNPGYGDAKRQPRYLLYESVFLYENDTAADIAAIVLREVDDPNAYEVKDGAVP